MIWWLGKFCAFCSLLAVIGWLFFQQTVHSKLSTTIQNQLNEKLAGSPLSATIGGAQFIEGQGIRLNNFRLTLNAIETDDSSLQTTAGGTPAHQPASQIEIYEAFVHVPVSMTELVSCKTKPAAIRIRRARIRLNQNTSGDWNLPALWDEIQKLRDPTCGPVPFSCTDCTIELVSTHSTTPLQITDVGLEVLPIQHEGRSLIQIRGHLNSQLISNTDFTLFFDLTQKTWMLEKFSVAQIELSPAILQMLPTTLSRSLTQSFRRSIGESPNQTSEKLLDVSGRIAITGSASGDMDFQTAPQFRCDGQLTNFNLTDARLPLPIQNGQLKFAINNDEIAVTQIQGMLGNSPFEGEYRQVGVFPRRTWDAQGRITDFDFTHHEKLTPSLPEFCEKLCEEYSPAGLSDIQFRFQHDGTQLTRDIRGELTDMSFSYDRMPYAVDHCVGEILLHNDTCEFEIRNGAGQPEMKMDGVVQNVGPNATYKINLLVPGELPIDDKMLTALAAQPTIAKIINDFNPSGRASGIGLIIKQTPGGPVSKSFDIRLKQCNVRHTSFQYPIHNVSGLVQIRNDQYSFADITGSNSSAEIRCNGTWNPTAGLNLIFNCSAVPLDNQLRFALNPDLREIWAGFRPRGTVDQMRVEMQLPIGAPSCLVAVDANLSKPVAGVEANLVSINPTWFPYEIRRLTGNIKIGNGKVQLSNMEGLHGKTWVVCQGDGHYSDDSWSVKLKNMLVTSLKVDEDLIAALPANLAPPIRGLAFQGLLNVHGEITLAGQEKILIAPSEFTSPASMNATNSPSTAIIPNATTAPTTTNSPSKMTNSMAWDLRFDMNQAKMQVGLPLENVFGKVNLTGQYDGENATCSGELNIDSLTIHDAQITKISGPIWLDNSHTAAGAFADQAKLKLANSKPNSNSNSNSNATRNVAPRHAQNANPNFSPLLQSPPTTRSVTGSMHGGVIRFDARMSSDPAGEFHLQTTLADGNLAQFCREFAPQLTDISGHSFAALRLAGNYRGTHSYRGTGTIQLREAKIYELPVMLSLLKILKVGNADRTAFDTSNANFTIDGEDIYFDRIEMLGDAISLVGNGTMNLDRDIDLNFYSIMGRGRFNIPLVSKLYHASSQQILWINVKGTLDEPRTHRNVLPQVNDSLKQLFQPAEPNAFVREWNRSIGNGTPVQSGLDQYRAEPQGAAIEREANRSSSLFR